MKYFFSLILGLPKKVFSIQPPFLKEMAYKERYIYLLYPKLKLGTRKKLVSRRELFCKTVSLWVAIFRNCHTTSHLEKISTIFMQSLRQSSAGSFSTFSRARQMILRLLKVVVHT